MIVSVSRRTDIPAFYSEWFFDKIKKGSVSVINPFNRKQVSKIELNPNTVDCFVFWTKNPKPMIPKLEILNQMGFPYYFQFTITSYQRDVEPGLDNKNDILRTCKELSQRIGKERVIWRYDPILLSDKYTKEYHYEYFETFCKRLAGYTDKCVISFLDMYDKIKKNMRNLNLIPMTQDDMIEIASRFVDISKQYGITIETCSENIDLIQLGIRKGKCIDDRLIERIIGCKLDVKKDENQREECGCVKSIDIGQYNCCRHFCAYCYANYSQEQVIEHMRCHRIESDILIGDLLGDEQIITRPMKSIVDHTCEQLELKF